MWRLYSDSIVILSGILQPASTQMACVCVCVCVFVRVHVCVCVCVFMLPVVKLCW